MTLGQNEMKPIEALPTVCIPTLPSSTLSDFGELGTAALCGNISHSPQALAWGSRLDQSPETVSTVYRKLHFAKSLRRQAINR